MLALSGNEILLGEAAELGPIDPQLRIVVDQRVVTVPAGAAIDQFARIHQEIADYPEKVRGWLPIIRQYGPSFLQECHNAVDRSQALVAEWLSSFMFKDEDDAKGRATRVAGWLANHSNFKSHARPVWMRQLLEIEPTMRIMSLRAVSTEFEAAVMELYWAIEITFDSTNAFKLIEHKSRSAYIRLQQVVAAGPIPAPAKGSPSPSRKRKR